MLMKTYYYADKFSIENRLKKLSEFFFFFFCINVPHGFSSHRLRHLKRCPSKIGEETKDIEGVEKNGKWAAGKAE